MLNHRADKRADGGLEKPVCQGKFGWIESFKTHFKFHPPSWECWGGKQGGQAEHGVLGADIAVGKSRNLHLAGTPPKYSFLTSLLKMGRQMSRETCRFSWSVMKIGCVISGHPKTHSVFFF